MRRVSCATLVPPASAPVVIPEQRKPLNPIQAMGEKLLNDIEAHLKRFVFIDNEHAYAVMAAWAVHTHVYLWQDATPRLHFVAKKPNQGKSEAMKVLRPICSGIWRARSNTGKKVPRGAFFTGRGTGAGLIGLINQTGDIVEDVYNDDGMLVRERGKYHGTIMLDDYDSVFERGSSKDLLNVFKIGYMPGNSDVKMRGGEVLMQETYIPMAIAGIQSPHLDPASLSRCITFHMRAPENEEEKPEETYAIHVHDKIGNKLHERVKTWASFIETRLPEASPDVPGLINRDRQIWKPLVAIAEMASPEWAERIKAAATFFTTGKEPIPKGKDEEILHKVVGIFEDWELDRLPAELIIKQMNAEGFPDITNRSLTVVMDVKSVKQKLVLHPETGKRVRGYVLEDIRSAL